MKIDKEFLNPAPANYVWPQCPEADELIRTQIDLFLGGHAFARRLSERMREETSTEFQSWVDQVILPKSASMEHTIKKLGFIKDNAKAPKGAVIYWHPFADLPRIVLAAGAKALSCAIMVDSIADFQVAHHLALTVEGKPYGQYRECRIPGEKGALHVIERRGTRAIVPDQIDRAAKYLSCVEMWMNRRRVFPKPADGMKHAEQIAKQMAKLIGSGMAAWAFLEGERRYWQTKNRAAQVQKARQDRLGLGWANHDHHTFRSGRPAFTSLMRILQTFGFKKRERYYAGAEAGWGAQIMEQPEARLIIFADVDLSPAEVTVDFSKVTLNELPKPGTVGLWCALHGESMLEAGMHHLEAKFDFDHLRQSLKNQNVNFMNPFSDFPHLRQAFSEGEIWKVPNERLEPLLIKGRISQEAYERFKQNGAVGSHMENLQRRNGFKGFNQRGVSHIIREVNPESQALKNNGGAA